jgi:hypothetical protein
MRNLISFITIMLILAVLAPRAGYAEDVPAAILLSCTGSVTIEKEAGGEIPGSFGLALFAGDVVKTAAESGQ